MNLIDVKESFSLSVSDIYQEFHTLDFSDLFEAGSDEDLLSLRYDLWKISVGLPRLSYDEAILSKARHEAGHALVSRYYGEHPSYVTITSGGEYGGYVQLGTDENRGPASREDLLIRISIGLAGRAAEIVCYGEEKGINTGASSDLYSATKIAEAMISRYGMDDEYGMAVFEADLNDPLFRRNISEILKDRLDEDIHIISRYREIFDLLVDELVKKNHMNQDELEAILPDSFMES